MKQFKRQIALGVTLVAVVVLGIFLLKSGTGQTATAQTSAQNSTSNAPASAAAPADSVTLESSQLNSLKIETLGTRPFCLERTAVGNIDYNEDLSVQVFSPYQGKIIAAFANLGDEIQKGQPLYTIDSPDLAQAESTLVGAAATYDLTHKEFVRARDLYATNGVSQREMEQATSDEEASEGALKAARDAVRVFGKSEEQIDQIVASRKIDAVLTVASPVTGRITARNAQSGLLVQPGNTPAPYAVADLSTKWMLANVIESDSPLLHIGQTVKATVMAYPGRVFDGKIAALSAAVDATTHRIMVRCAIADPKDELRPNMLANFVIQIQDNPTESVSIPVNGIVRNGDGTMAAWVTTDKHRFTRKLVKIGLQQGDQYQILDGLQSGDLAVTDGAIFLSNLLDAPPSD
jgi:cobalt-zinc-cadmium efflux system membrane fusion protein